MGLRVSRVHDASTLYDDNASVNTGEVEGSKVLLDEGRNRSTMMILYVPTRNIHKVNNTISFIGCLG